MKFLFEENIFLLLILVIFITGCTSTNKTINTLEKGGFTDIEVGSWDVFACSESDWFSTKFIATNPVGQKTDGTVCCGLIFKSCTIRY